MVTRSRNSPGIISAQKKGYDASPISVKKRDLKNRHKEKENINLNHRSASKLDPSDEKKQINSPI